MNPTPIIVVHDLVKRFEKKRLFRIDHSRTVLATNHVSLEVLRGSTLGIVGESGSGKTTLARMIAGLETPSEGTIELEGRDLSELSDRELFQQVQYVFQDPYSALNPKRTIEWSLDVPLRCLMNMGAQQRRTRIAELLKLVGLRPELAGRYPHQLSGGQRQRVVIARALAAEPEVLVLDEAVSALDVSVQAQILTLLKQLQEELGLTYLFISHDLAVIEYLCDEVLVMLRGEVVERGSRKEVFGAPQNDYTRVLLSSVPGSTHGEAA